MPGSEKAECRQSRMDRWPTSMKQSDTQPSAAYWTLSDYYLVALGVLLAGYAIVGKAFAYIGVPPVYIGDIVFALGIIVFLKLELRRRHFCHATKPSARGSVRMDYHSHAALSRRIRARRSAR